MPILITGFHSSGVDPLAKSMQNNGIYFGDEDELNFMEYKQWSTLGIEMTEYFTHDTLDDLKFTTPYKNPNWHRSRKMRPFNHITRLIAKEFIRRNKGVDWGFRSRRALIHLPLYKKNIKNLKVIIPIRYPNDVIESLFENKPYNKGRGHGDTREEIAQSWLDYHSIAIRDIEAMRIEFYPVQYENLITYPKETIENLVKSMKHKYVYGSENNIKIKDYIEYNPNGYNSNQKFKTIHDWFILKSTKMGT